MEGKKTPEDGLSERELEILVMLANGLTQPEIAEVLFLAHDTVKTHTYRVRKRWHARSTTHVVAMAVRRGYLDDLWWNQVQTVGGENGGAVLAEENSHAGS